MSTTRTYSAQKAGSCEGCIGVAIVMTDATLRMPSVRTHRMRPFPSRVSKRREREGTASREGCRAGDGVLSENSQRIERRLLS